jgi:DNA-nicking Smr family endonuclease
MGRFKARRGGKQDRGSRPAGDDAPARPERPPQIFLRMCSYEEALLRLDQQVRAYARQGRPEILVVHGMGHGSPGGRGILGDAVRDWCLRRGDLVLDWRPAPPGWGGDGAVVLTLNV